MLSEANITRINHQIAKELREADRFINSDAEKKAALERVAKLKTLLSEQTVQIDYDQLANSLIEQMTAAPRHQPHPLTIIFEAFARR